MSISIPLLGAFIAAQVGTPGPANMAVMATGARFGFTAALPFVAGVTVGKQLLVWPLGLGLLELAQQAPVFFAVLKYASAAYIVYLAWRIANLRLSKDIADTPAPGFLAGLIVHPLNPKAWGMIIAALTNFVPAGTSPLVATATLAATLFVCQSFFHPLWTYSGDRIARLVAGSDFEPYLMWTLAGITVLTVLMVLV